MELWVRSQDKKQLLKVNDGLFIANGFNDTNDTFIGIKNVGHIGRYAKEERALEVLDEIQNILHPNIIFKPFTHIDNNPKFTYVHTISESGEMQFQELSTYVYEMPEG